jgi:hypothetical protein
MKHLFVLLIFLFPFLTFSQERKIYITSKTASELASKFRTHDSLRRELILTKRELYFAKKKLLSVDSNMDATIIFMDSIYGRKILEQKKLITELKRENSNANKKIHRNKVIIILLSVAITISILVH